MSILEWDESFSVGDAEMDRQHQTLFVLLNRLYDARQSDGDPLLAGEALSSLHRYTRQHFAEEEALMARIGFAGQGFHKAIHAQLARQVEDFERRHAAGEPDIAQELVPFLLGDWLLEHISGMDSEYAHVLRQLPPE